MGSVTWRRARLLINYMTFSRSISAPVERDAAGANGIRLTFAVAAMLILIAVAFIAGSDGWTLRSAPRA